MASSETYLSIGSTLRASVLRNYLVEHGVASGNGADGVVEVCQDLGCANALSHDGTEPQGASRTVVSRRSC